MTERRSLEIPDLPATATVLREDGSATAMPVINMNVDEVARLFDLDEKPRLQLKRLLEIVNHSLAVGGEIETTYRMVTAVIEHFEKQFPNHLHLASLDHTPRLWGYVEGFSQGREAGRKGSSK